MRRIRDWNHNTHYDTAVLAAIPHDCGQALDVGCGTGSLARQIAGHCQRVTAIDLAPQVIASAMAAKPAIANLTLVSGDIMNYPLPPEGYTFLSSVATLHHLPLEAALRRFRELLSPRGVLIVIGLYRPEGPMDALHAIAGFVSSQTMRQIYRFQEVDAPMKAPDQRLSEIRRAAAQILPGYALNRRLFFRYCLTWRKPIPVAEE